MTSAFSDRWLGPCIRSLPDSKNTLYLTFDDGPNPACTPAVLDCLESHGAQATFFLVAERAEHHKALTTRIRENGHAIGNHSLDHRYSNFFSSRLRTLGWINQSEKLLTSLIGSPTVGFRSPAGVRTPPLHWALKKLELPLIHWSVRFFDTRLPWTERKALRSLERSQPGDIVLLHDTHAGPKQKIFLETLSAYLTEGSRRGFRFATIPRRP